MVQFSWSSIALILSVFVASAANSEEPQILSLKVHPQQLYTFQDKAVLFEAKIKNPPEGKLNWVLVQIKDGRVHKQLGVLSDSGFLGDRKKGDGIFTRKVRFKGRKPGRLEFAVILHDQAETLKSLESLESHPTGHLTFVRRPNFFELISQVVSQATQSL